MCAQTLRVMEVVGRRPALLLHRQELTLATDVSEAGAPKLGREVGGARDNLSVVLPALDHALSKLAGDTSDCAS